jgi:type I restriction enzyme S subunit
MDITGYISTGAQPKLTKDSLNKISFPVPSLKVQQFIVDVLDRFDTLTSDLTQGLPAEIAARQRQYEHYRDQLLTFREKTA